MTSERRTIMFPTKNDLSSEVRQKVVKLLSDRLADAIDLGLQAKQAHWNVKGPNFIALHELFDSVAGAATEHTDEIAERITALGGVADGTLKSVAARTSLKPYPENLAAGRDHVEALATALAAFGKNIRAAIDLASAAGDQDTADLFTGVSRDVDKKLWFVEAHLHAER
jgi:starvation-inducible DNA-binding protein